MNLPSPSLLIQLYSLMRKLAKSNRYQILYSQHKEIGVNIFQNISNYTDFQIAFMHYLSFYASLYMSIYMDEVGEVVLEDEIFEDAYSYYKSKNKKVERKEYNKTLSNKSKNSARNRPTASKTHVVFSRPKIKR